MLKFAMYYLSLSRNLIGWRNVSKQQQCISQPKETCRLCRKILTHTTWVKCLALHSDITHLIPTFLYSPLPSFPLSFPSLPPSLHLVLSSTLPPSPLFYSLFPSLLPLSFLSSFLFCPPPSLYRLSVTFPPATLIWDRGTPERSRVHTANGGLPCRTLTQREEGGASRKYKRFCTTLPLSSYLCSNLCQQHARFHNGTFLINLHFYPLSVDNVRTVGLILIL